MVADTKAVPTGRDDPAAVIPLDVVAQAAGGWAALRAAWRLGVLDRLAATPVGPATLARTAGLDPRLTAAVLEALAALGVAAVDADGRYRVSAQLAPVVAWADRVYGPLADAWRQDVTGPRYDEPEGAAAHYPELVALLPSTAADLTDEVANRLAQPGLSVLDVGAGAAPWSLAIVRREPTCHVTALDLPDVIDTTRERVAAAGRADRYAFVGADVFAHVPDGRYDLVLVGAVCHLFDDDVAARLVARLADVLSPGGRLAIIDGLADDDRDPAGRALYELGLALRTRGGRLHTSTACRRWLTDAGLAGLTTHRLSATSNVHLLVGQRAE